MEKTWKYHVMVKSSPMEIVGVPMWRGVYFDTEEEANEAIKRARDESTKHGLRLPVYRCGLKK